MNFGQNLKENRLALSLTQKEMADYLEISERGYRYYEMGTREPNLTTLVKIADYFNISLDDLVGRDYSK